METKISSKEISRAEAALVIEDEIITLTIESEKAHYLIQELQDEYFGAYRKPTGGRSEDARRAAIL